MVSKAIVPFFTQQHKMAKRMGVFIRYTAVVAVLALFLIIATRNLTDLDFASVEWKLGPLLLSVVFLQSGMMVNVLLMKFVLRFLGSEASFKDAYNAYFISNVGRYIPGKIWQILILTRLARSHGVGAIEGSTLFTINQLLVVISGFLFVFFLLVFDSTILSKSLFIIIIILSSVIFLFPGFLVKTANFFLSRLTFREIQYSITRKYALCVAGFVFISYFFTGVGFAFLTYGIGLPVADPCYLVAVYPLSYLIGYLSLITPGGIGVRESAVMFLLRDHFSTEMAALLSVIALIWFVAVELLNGAIAMNSVGRARQDGRARSK